MVDTGNCNLNVKTPRLIIQPLAENCFRHGFSNTEPPWHIRVRVYSDEKMWYAEIVDNGGGIPPESVDQVNRNVERFFEHPQQEMERLGIGGLGLTSSVIRLKLFYGQDMVFSVASGNDGGAAVTVGGKLQPNCNGIEEDKK